ncbi:uncharacterized protein [Branchiostoma lanceolatum]|uniref:uncharacterized protein n=1 Tax=Branchiostoma lanceolatum TaxID=7740 RepID=UPI00345661B0
MLGRSVLLAAVVLSVCGDVLELYAAAAPRWSRGDGRRMERWTAALVGRKPARYDRLQTGEDVGERGELPIGRARRAMRESETGRVRTPRQVQVSTDLSLVSYGWHTELIMIYISVCCFSTDMRESGTGRVRTPRQVQVSTDLSMILLREMLKEARQKLEEEKSRSHNQNLFNMIG